MSTTAAPPYRHAHDLFRPGDVAQRRQFAMHILDDIKLLTHTNRQHRSVRIVPDGDGVHALYTLRVDVTSLTAERFAQLVDREADLRRIVVDRYRAELFRVGAHSRRVMVTWVSDRVPAEKATLEVITDALWKQMESAIGADWDQEGLLNLLDELIEDEDTLRD